MSKTAPRGFTLVELLVVITIIAILSTIGITVYSGIQSRARDTQRLDDARKIVTALEQFKSGAGRYPGPGCGGWCNSIPPAANWIPELDVSNFVNSRVPVDPKNTDNPELKYYYNSDAAGQDYCLQISQENNVTGHPYYKKRDGNGNTWKLRFGPNGANSGYCNRLQSISE